MCLFNYKAYKTSGVWKLYGSSSSCIRYFVMEDCIAPIPYRITNCWQLCKLLFLSFPHRKKNVSFCSFFYKKIKIMNEWKKFIKTPIRCLVSSFYFCSTTGIMQWKKVVFSIKKLITQEWYHCITDKLVSNRSQIT